MSESHIPLPERLRPRDLAQIIGQDHLLGEQAPLRQMIDQGHLPVDYFLGATRGGENHHCFAVGAGGRSSFYQPFCLKYWGQRAA